LNIRSEADVKLKALLQRYLKEGPLSFCHIKDLQVNSIGLECETLLHMACGQGRLDDVRTLVYGGAMLDALDATGSPPLNRAIYSDNFEIVDFLLSHGARTNIIDNFGGSTIDKARKLAGDRRVLELLVKRLNSEAT
jgi:ankyrin repeat protein